MKLPVNHVPGVGLVKNQGGFGGFGQKMLERMGWERGQGLGREKSGMADAIEVNKKEDNLGVSALGHSEAQQGAAPPPPTAAARCPQPAAALLWSALVPRQHRALKPRSLPPACGRRGRHRRLLLNTRSNVQAPPAPHTGWRHRVWLEVGLEVLGGRIQRRHQGRAARRQQQQRQRQR